MARSGRPSLNTVISCRSRRDSFSRPASSPPMPGRTRSTARISTGSQPMSARMHSPGTQTVMDDFDGDNFDHSGLGFLGGCKIQLGHADGRPISYRPVPPGTPRWGAAWKKATAKWYQHAARITLSGSNYANRYNYIDLDPTYKDQLGRPLLRMTYNFVENDYKVADYCMAVALKIARAMSPTMMGPPGLRRGDYNTVPYQSTHNTGGTIMGNDPKRSVVNRYLQTWDAD